MSGNVSEYKMILTTEPASMTGTRVSLLPSATPRSCSFPAVSCLIFKSCGIQSSILNQSVQQQQQHKRITQAVNLNGSRRAQHSAHLSLCRSTILSVCSLSFWQIRVHSPSTVSPRETVSSIGLPVVEVMDRRMVG